MYTIKLSPTSIDRKDKRRANKIISSPDIGNESQVLKHDKKERTPGYDELKTS
jgi:hypothetical protein